MLFCQECLELVQIYFGHSNQHFEFLGLQDSYGCRMVSSSSYCNYSLYCQYILSSLEARNLSRFEDKKIHCKNYILNISDRAKFTSNLTSKLSNSSITNFSLLKKFNISIHP